MTPARLALVILLALPVALPALADPPMKAEGDLNRPSNSKEGPAGGGFGKSGASGGELPSASRGKVGSAHLDAYRRRAEAAAALGDVEQAIAELERLLADLIEERLGWRRAREEAPARITEVKRQLASIESDIDDIEAAIALSQGPTPGSASPALVARLAELRSRRSDLERELLHEQARRDAAAVQIGEIDRMMAKVERDLAAWRSKRELVEKAITAVEITAPSQGSRLRVGTRHALQLRADQPPDQVHIEVLTRTGGWRQVYSRSWPWKDLESAGPSAARLPFHAVEVSDRSLPPSPGTLRLEPGKYRARVEGLPRGQGVSEREFEVVGRVHSDVLKPGAPAASPGGGRFQPGAKDSTTPAAAEPAGTPSKPRRFKPRTPSSAATDEEEEPSEESPRFRGLPRPR